jgi:ABC-type multidrug transport system fused ATPase/permease subunit
MFKTFEYLKPYIGQAVLNIIFNVLTAFFSIISMVLLKPFLDILFAAQLPEIPDYEGASYFSLPIIWFNRTLISYITEYGHSAALFWVCVIIVGCFFFKNLFRYLSLYVMAPVRNGIEHDIRNNVYDKLIQLPLSYFSSERKGDLMSRLSSDVSEIQWSILRSLETLVRSPITLLGSLAVMIYVSPGLTLFSFGLFLVVGLGIGRLSKSLRKNSGKAQESLGMLLSIIDETIGGLRVIQGFGADDYQKSKFRKENQSYLSLGNKIQRRRELASPMSEFLGICVIAALLLYGGNLVFSGQFEASTFVMFILMFYNIIDPAKNFASAMYDIQKGRAAADRIAGILDNAVDIKDSDAALPLNNFEKEISIENVSFSYDGQQQVLNDISFTLKKGKSIALVGVSGSGKSTIADLLPRFYEPSSGRIVIDGHDIKDYKLRDLRAQFGIVSQDAILFNDSIYNNIVFGLKNTNPEKVIAAAKIAQAHDFIMETENGYESTIGDRGMKLSGGQRQRLTLARAVLRNPPVLLMDEATSALDSESEKAVQKALEQLLSNCSAIIIAHRLSTIRNVDEIIVLQEGKIMERGRHEDLIAMDGIYKKLVELQKL